jgi:hypothetical protein
LGRELSVSFPNLCVTILSAYLRSVESRNKVRRVLNQGDEFKMRKIMAGLALLLVSMQAASVRAQSSKYSPLSEYTVTPEAEIALARSAAPENVSAHATVKVLTASGYKVAVQGDNGFV